MRMGKTMQRNPTTNTYDEASLDASRSFLDALQELKNLRPQLYSAAVYCEKSYIYSEEKQPVLENLKDYALRALVNTVDHLGTVAYNLNDLFEQQSFDVSTSEVKISCLSQQLLTCQTYMGKEGLRQQQKMTINPRYHKHYNLPASVSRRVQGSPHKQIDIKGKQIQVEPRPHLMEISPPQTLSWHLASKDASPLHRVPYKFAGMECHKASGPTPQVFYMMDAEEAAVSSRPALPHLQSFIRSPISSSAMHTFCGTQKESPEVTKRMSPFRSFNTSNQHRISLPLGRSKSMLSAFFSKRKFSK